MANIPEPGLPDVAPRPLPVPEQGPGGASPDTFGAGEARTAQRVVGFADELFRQAKQKADDTAIVGAFGQAKAALNQIVLDVEHGYASLHGADAMAGREKALSEFDKSMDNITGSLTEDQRLRFEHQALFIKEQAFSHVIQHETHEQNQYAISQYRGAVDQTMVTMENPAVVADPKSLKEQIDSLWQTGIDEAHRRFGQNASKDAIASVVIPELQRGAYGTMQAAVGMSETTGNPEFAKQALDQVGRYLVTGHHRDFAKVVEALSAKAAITSGVGQIMAGAIESVVVPGGPPIAHLDEVKFAAGVDATDPQTPHYAEIVKAAEAQRETRAKVWSAAVGNVVQRVESAALKGGPFDLSRSGVSPTDLEWLRTNAPGTLIKLQNQEHKADTGASKEAWSDRAADMANPGRRDFYLNLSVPEFTKMTIDDGMGPTERLKAQKLFGDMLKGAQSEKINRTVAEQLLAVLPNNKIQREKLQGPVFDRTNAWIDEWRAGSEGKGPTTEQIRQFINHELVQVKVPGTGLIFNDRGRRVLMEANPAYAGKTFEPVDTEPPLPVRAATPVLPAGRITVRNPAGKAFTLPSEQVDEFLKSPEGKGFSR